MNNNPEYSRKTGLTIISMYFLYRVGKVWGILEHSANKTSHLNIDSQVEILSLKKVIYCMVISENFMK